MERIVFLVILWIIGVFIAIIGDEQIQNYKDYRQPRLVLIVGIILSCLMSWAKVIIQALDRF